MAHKKRRRASDARKGTRADETRRASELERVRVEAERERDAMTPWDDGWRFMLRRFGSWVVDAALTGTLVALFVFFGSVSERSQDVELMNICAGIMVFFFLLFIPKNQKGRTLGQMLFRLRIVNVRGGERSWSQLLVREVIVKFLLVPFTLPIFIVDYLIVGLIAQRDPHRRLWIDRLQNTYVRPVL